jgi:hypothetical protein
MNTKKLKLPTLIIVMGMLLAVLSCFITCIIKEPVIKEHDFEYSVTYMLDGEEQTLNGLYKCSFLEIDTADLGNVREYTGVHEQNGVELYERSFLLAEKNGVELHVEIMLDENYLMGDSNIYIADPGNDDPYLIAYDAEDMVVEVSEVFDAEIIGWDFPEPIENSFKFAGFSILHAVSMLVMISIAVLTIIACGIFVKKDVTVKYNWIDKLSTVFNYIIGFVVIPLFVVFIWAMQIVESEETFSYQAYLCLPALMTFTIAASVALRRKGFKKIGMLVQLVCPVLAFAHLILGSFI